METAAHPRSLAKSRSVGMMLGVPTSFASFGAGVGNTFRCAIYRVTKYDDDYPTCSSTYATLRIYPGVVSLEDITSRLNITPTSTQAAEERPAGVMNLPAGWFLTSKDAVESRDVRRHIDWILNQIAEKSDVFKAFRDTGVQADISCYWATASGHGGPSLWPTQMAILGSLSLEIWFDVYAG